jgi:hypothetical protein
VGEWQRGTWDQEVAPLIAGLHYEGQGSTRDEERGNLFVVPCSAFTWDEGVRGTREYEELGTRKWRRAPSCAYEGQGSTRDKGVRGTRTMRNTADVPRFSFLVSRRSSLIPRPSSRVHGTNHETPPPCFLIPRPLSSLVPRKRNKEQQRHSLVPGSSYSLVPRNADQRATTPLPRRSSLVLPRPS